MSEGKEVFIKIQNVKSVETNKLRPGKKEPSKGTSKTDKKKKNEKGLTWISCCELEGESLLESLSLVE